MNRYKVIFDTDPGIDDAVALLLLHAMPSVDLQGITTVFGNASIEDCTRNALYICERFDLPYGVFQGAGVSFRGAEGDEYPDFVHGRDGLGDVGFAAPSKRAAKVSAADFIVQAARLSIEPLEILAVGRMTNVAQALEMAPDIKTKLRRIVMMGGAVDVRGNVTEWAEANIYGDPEAADYIFQSGVPVLMVGLDATLEHQISRTQLAALTHDLGDAGDFIWQIKQHYLNFYASKGIFDGFPIHDATAALGMAFPDDFKMAAGALRCVTEGEERGRTIFSERQGGFHQVALSAEGAELSQRFDAMMRAQFGAPSSAPVE